ncbi:uncharacterized protein N7496_004494 [Penicillium cataractarum]|uniref:MARVEL domain-containing protein n=1 Tax=Penicillium cataractarum TaxID=2100454 RepID=A0A9W9SP55_9EURO|nr:uncharacterized protein N7496_004494 [Penicillium cataractarum]KAJ5382066.1 hypothetical protein N7496_004494 [Penicillium cataractarum]
MMQHAKVIRPFLFSVRLLLWISAVITLGLTAWVVDHLKGYRAIFTLVIAVLTTAFYIPSLFTACMRCNRGYMIPLDIVFYALWLSAFIFVAQTDDLIDGAGCSYFLWDLAPQKFLTFPFPNTRTHVLIYPQSFWTFCGLCLETLNVFLNSRHSAVATVNHPEKLSSSGRGVNNGTTTAPGADPAPALNGEHTQV